MNPYDFVSLSGTPDRKPYKPHHKFDGKSGLIKCVAETKTPLFISDGKQNNPVEFIKKNGKHVIPGSSLKGLIRSVAEAVGNGCMSLFDGIYERRTKDYSKKIPPEFRKCTSIEELCPCCRIFGMMERENISIGNVSISDGEITGEVKYYGTVIIPPLMNPNPRHTAFYIKDNKITGRKFYFHHPKDIKIDFKQTRFNKQIKPLDKGNKFLFEVTFSNLSGEELSLLLYSLVLESNMCHKIGMGKPVGLGTIKIIIDEINLYDDMKDRYKSISHNGKKSLSGKEKDDFISAMTRVYYESEEKNLKDLRRIWKFDPSDNTDYRYPTMAWFKNNSQKTILETP